jgi:hypothetical protein
MAHVLIMCVVGVWRHIMHTTQTEQFGNQSSTILLYEEAQVPDCTRKIHADIAIPKKAEAKLQAQAQ